MFHKTAIILFFFYSFSCFASDTLSYYLVYFKDKGEHAYRIDDPIKYLSRESIQRRLKWRIPITQQDFPVNAHYLRSLAGIEGVRVINSSKWLNAAEISIAKKNGLLQQIKEFEFILKTEFIGDLKSMEKPRPDEISDEYYLKSKQLKAKKKDGIIPLFSESDYGKSFSQNNLIGIPKLQKMIGRKNTIHLAVFDAGFHNAYRITGMEDLLDSSVIIRDFVDYDQSVWEDDQHGTNVLGFMKTYHPGYYIGSSPFARYTLLRTENSKYESPTEEVNWLFGAEFADSLGVDIIISSLGYHNFDDTILNHTRSQMDGKTSIIARAANFASARGIAVICSAGNDGNSRWHRIGTPGDADGVITVGACDANGFHAGFSSFGPTSDGRVKPDFLTPGNKVSVVSIYGSYPGNGTSYSTPIFAGAMANLMMLFPESPFATLRDALIQSATHRNIPDSAYGYGLPDFELAGCILGICDSSFIAGDIFWMNEPAVLFQDLNIHFRSSLKQTIHVWIKIPEGDTVKTVYKTSKKLKPGEWYQSDVLLRLVGGSKKIRRRKTPYHSLLLVLECYGGSFQRTIHLN